MTSFSAIFRRARRIRAQDLPKVVLPRFIDEWLYVARTCPVTVADEDDLKIVRYNPDNPSGEERIDRMLAAERTCYRAILGTETVHESWVFRDAILPSRFGYDPLAPLIGNCVTRPEYRGRRIYERVLMFIVNDLLAEGGDGQVLILVSPENVASIRGIERAGFDRIDRLRGLRLLGFVVKWPRGPKPR